MRRQVILITLGFILLAINYSIWKKESTIANGEIILIELGPKDPRSLMQGDYMILRYRLPRQLQFNSSKLPNSGLLVLSVNDKHVAEIKRRYDEKSSLQKNERLIHYKIRARGIRIGAESFFFQEGHRKIYAKARYGELRLSQSGQSVLIGLRDKDLLPLRPTH